MRLLLATLLIPFFSLAQREVKPVSVNPITLSPAGEAKFLADQAAIKKVTDKVASGVKLEELAEEERKLYDYSDFEDYWETLGPGCSWYCGGRVDSIYASSTLKAQGTNTYEARNLHDFTLKTAWVEGVKGYGIGEFIKYEFPADCPRVTTVIIANGYVKNEQAYRDNSRVKKLKMYVNDKPYAILDLEDKRSQQYFKFDPIGNGDRSTQSALLKQGPWSLTFEILDVYQGAKYDDVVISELYFDGIDVH